MKYELTEDELRQLLSRAYRSGYHNTSSDSMVALVEDMPLDVQEIIDSI